MLFVGIVSDLIVTVKGLLGTHAVFAEYAVLLQQKRRELSEKLRLGAEEGRERIRELSAEERGKASRGSRARRGGARKNPPHDGGRARTVLCEAADAPERPAAPHDQQLPAVEADAQQRSARRSARGNGKGEKRRSSGKDEPAKRTELHKKRRTTGRLCVFLCRF